MTDSVRGGYEDEPKPSILGVREDDASNHCQHSSVKIF